MNSRFVFRYRHALAAVFVLSAVSAFLLLPLQSPTKAEKGLSQRTLSHDADLPNYDIRLDKAAHEKIAAFRAAQGKSAAQVADTRAASSRGEQELRKRVP